jgi:mono/diheme cytochrome c family protein
MLVIGGLDGEGSQSLWRSAAQVGRRLSLYIRVAVRSGADPAVATQGNIEELRAALHGVMPHSHLPFVVRWHST